ncbi:hypothetical protein VDIAB_220084 [Vibrio diabolicus]|nr:hypothetical protein VDIAB_220084 [Vibrio diabolicus]
MPRLRSRVRTSCVAPNFIDMALAVSDGVLLFCKGITKNICVPWWWNW